MGGPFLDRTSHLKAAGPPALATTERRQAHSQVWAAPGDPPKFHRAQGGRAQAHARTMAHLNDGVDQRKKRGTTVHGEEDFLHVGREVVVRGNKEGDNLPEGERHCRRHALQETSRCNLRRVSDGALISNDIKHGCHVQS